MKIFDAKEVKRVSDLIRFALWEAYNRQCFYNMEKIDLQNMDIDHILPRALKRYPGEFESIKARLKLPKVFALDSLENLVPTSREWNIQKSDAILPDDELKRHLSRARDMKEEVQQWLKKLEADPAYLRLLYNLYRRKPNYEDLPEKVYDFLTDEPPPQDRKRLSGNPLVLESGKVGLSCFVPDEEDSGKLLFSALVTLRKVTLRDALITYGSQDLLESLFVLPGVPLSARKWVVGLEKSDDTCILQLANVRCGISIVDAERLANYCDAICEIAFERARKVEALWETLGFEPAGNDVWKLLKVRRGLWDLLIAFAREHDMDRGSTAWHVFNSNNGYINTMAEPDPRCGLSRRCVLLPRLASESYSFLPNDEEVWISWSRQHYRSNSGHSSNLATTTAAEACSWLVTYLIPAAVEWAHKKGGILRRLLKPLPSFELKNYGKPSLGYQPLVLDLSDSMKHWVDLIEKVQSYFNCRPNDLFPKNLLEQSLPAFSRLLELFPHENGIEAYIRGNLLANDGDLSEAGRRYQGMVARDGSISGFSLDLFWRGIVVLIRDSGENGLKEERRQEIFAALNLAGPILAYVDQELYRERLVTIAGRT